MVGETGLEPVHLTIADFKSAAAAGYATLRYKVYRCFRQDSNLYAKSLCTSFSLSHLGTLSTNFITKTFGARGENRTPTPFGGSFLDCYGYLLRHTRIYGGLSWNRTKRARRQQIYSLRLFLPTTLPVPIFRQLLLLRP